jgi:AhpD family alkylhydroperoxidase
MARMARSVEARGPAWAYHCHPLQQQEDAMRKSTLFALTLASAFTLATNLARAQDASAEAAYRDIEQTLGTVPTFFRQFPESGIAAAWGEFKSVQLNPNTRLSGKVKELIGLGVAAQIPCHYCVYFHTVAAKANGATDAEIREAVAMAAIVRHWSTVLNGMQIDPAGFRNEVDTVMKIAADKAKAASR